ncbi:hypothetical protein [Zunongwangia sp.]|uniref:hypothetical protein n=1 Tax=Zunongwangia sp. TaxID=1965325 RepID=UPI003AA8B162
MKKIVLGILIATIITTFSCQKDENNPFLITPIQVGKLKKTTKINQLDSIFRNDSIVKNSSESMQLRGSTEIEIFDKGGAPLLTVEPSQAFDSTSTVGYIRVLDSRYKTKAGLNTKSTFKDIVENYKISRIENTISSAVVFLDEINAYITIDKKELPSQLRYDTNAKIRASQIPDNASFKYFMIYWQ